MGYLPVSITHTITLESPVVISQAFGTPTRDKPHSLENFGSFGGLLPSSMYTSKSGSAPSKFGLPRILAAVALTS
eukprot:scaffold300364_cov52-Prasinocladus_malaysianus.AAC.1